MRVLSLFAILFVSFGSMAKASPFCLWEVMDLPGQLGMHDAVFFGKVTLVNSFPIQAGQLVRQVHAVDFQVERVWKGPKTGKLIVYQATNRSDAIRMYQSGESWLIFAKNTPGRDLNDIGGSKILPDQSQVFYETGQCTASIPAKSLADLVEGNDFYGKFLRSRASWSVTDGRSEKLSARR